MKNKIKKFIQFFTDTREVGIYGDKFVNQNISEIERQAREDKKQLDARIWKIRAQNKERIIKEKLIPRIIETTLINEGYLTTHQRALEIAIEQFHEATRNGNLNEFNQLIQEVA